MPDIPTEQKTATKSKVIVAVIGVLALAAAAAFAILPQYIQDSTGTKTQNAKPLKVVDITRAWADVDQYGPMFPLAYKAGSRLIYSQTQRVGDDESPDLTGAPGFLSIENTDATTPLVNSVSALKRLFVTEPARAATKVVTPYSIEDLPSTGIPTQLILIRYRQQNDTNDSSDRYLTICVGKTTAQKVYVGTDGSTYTNSKLTNRTTSESCSSITARAFTPTKVTGGSLIAEPSALQGLTWQFVRFFIPLANFDRQGYNMPDSALGTQFVSLPSKTPLYAGLGLQDPNVAPNTPAAIFRIESEVDGVATTTALCFPRQTVNFTSPPVLYFDNQGTAYNDIMLKNRAMTTSCPELIAKSFAPESVTKANTSPVLPGTEEDGYYTLWVANRGKTIGVTNGTLWQTIDNELSRNIVHPLVLGLGGGITGDPPTTIPSVNVSITDGTGKVSKLCFAGGSNVTKSTVISWQLLYYYDNALKPYKDMFLTEPVTCTPQSGGGSGSTPIRIPDDDIGTSPL